MRTYEPIVHVNGQAFERIMIKTHTIMPGENIYSVLQQYVAPQVQPGDVVFMSEKATSASQGRAIPVDAIHPSPLARFLVRFVTKSPHGIGLGMAETMEMAIREVGVPRLLLATIIGGLFKLVGIRGVFYRIAGRKARSIDGPTHYAIPPYNRYVVLGVDKPDNVCQEASRLLGVPVAIVDANDLGVNVIGVSHSSLKDLPLTSILKDNPAGQSDESTPFGIIRRASASVVDTSTLGRATSSAG